MTPFSAITSDSLVAFSAFAHHRNFTRAAAELHIAQPSLHTKIAKLSDALGVALYERIGRTLHLTPEGEELQRFAADMSKRAEDFVMSLAGESKSVSLFAGRGMLRWVLSAAIRDALRSGLAIDVNEADRSASLLALRAGQADVVGVAAEPPPVELASVEIARFEQVALLPAKHRLSKKLTVSTTDLADEPIVVPSAERPHRRQLERAFAEHGLSLRVAAEVDGWDLMAHMASLGLGIAIVNGSVPTPKRMVAVPLSDLPSIGYWLAWRPERANAAAAMLGVMS